ncbi:MAG: DUF2939 domain-containing protein [Desulfobacteraceae bacterium]|nr:MAG: DUF2939 domain-containing protein [Desulfobacteraceae bacterium]
MKRIYPVIAALVLIFLAAYIGASPYFTMVGIRDAVSAGDAERLRGNVDFAALRQNIKDQLNAAIFSNPDTGSRNNRFSALAKRFGSKVVDALTDAIITPEAIIAFVRNSSEFEKFKEKSAGYLGDAIALWQGGRSRYDSLSTLSYWPPIEDFEIHLVFTRAGLGWKLTNVILPPDWLKELFRQETGNMENPRK